ncbi:hypothetical protein [Planctellipticum variicoloris]|uniref:hypothetical protein n=1 Tax=Planctellipticum variicoloris TaxID=3064265 RepID=UPI003013234A|nr:hypothetical protein SH412_004949 [Planctomycetaceae bacterium SH412]
MEHNFFRGSAAVLVPAMSVWFWSALASGQDSPAATRPPEVSAGKVDELAVEEEFQLLLRQDVLSADELALKSRAELEAHLKLARRQKVLALRKLVQSLDKAWRAGARINQYADDQGVMSRALSDLARAEFDVAESREDRLAALKDWHRMVCDVEEIVRAKREAFALGGDDISASRAIANRLDVETALTRELLAGGQSAPQSK